MGVDVFFYLFAKNVKSDKYEYAGPYTRLGKPVEVESLRYHNYSKIVDDYGTGLKTNVDLSAIQLSEYEYDNLFGGPTYKMIPVDKQVYYSLNKISYLHRDLLRNAEEVLAAEDAYYDTEEDYWSDFLEGNDENEKGEPYILSEEAWGRLSDKSKEKYFPRVFSQYYRPQMRYMEHVLIPAVCWMNQVRYAEGYEEFDFDDSYIIAEIG